MTRTTNQTVRIARTELYSRGRLYPFSWLYRLEGETPNYEGAPLATIRRHAKRLAAERGAEVVETWKSPAPQPATETFCATCRNHPANLESPEERQRPRNTDYCRTLGHDVRPVRREVMS